MSQTAQKIPLKKKLVAKPQKIPIQIKIQADPVKPSLNQLRTDLIQHLDKYQMLQGVITDLIQNGKKKYGPTAFTQIANYLISQLASVFSVQKPQLFAILSIILEMTGFSTIESVEKQWLLSDLKPKVERTIDFLDKLINGKGGGGGQTLKDYETGQLLAQMPSIPNQSLETLQKQTQTLKKPIALQIQ